MTNDFKKKLLNYLVGNLKEETGSNIPSIHSVVERDNNLVDFIKQYYPSLTDNSWSISTLINRGDYISLMFMITMFGKNHLLLLQIKIMYHFTILIRMLVELH